MAEPDKKPVTMEELLVSSLAHTDALVKLLNELLKRKLATKHFAFVLYTLLAGLSVHASNKRRYVARSSEIFCINSARVMRPSFQSS